MAPMPFAPAHPSTVPPGVAPIVVVCVPTMRRPALLDATLRSLAAQDVDQPFCVLVVDNDPVGREGVAVAARWLAAGTLRGAAVVVSEPGNCAACNGAFVAARQLFPTSPFVAMIDDDEIADAAWLGRLLAAQAASGADLVGGPVFPLFERGDARLFATHPVFTPYYAASGPVPFLYGSGNVLMRAAVLDTMGEPAFDPVFNFVGGGDTDFFKRCREAGFTAVFASDARASETVPAARTRVRWVLARSMRYGTINYLVERKRARSLVDRLRIPLKSAALLGLSPLRAARALARSRNPLAATHPVMEALGRLAAGFGLQPEQYRQRR